MTEPDPANYPYWLIGRSAGIVAFVLIAASVILGLYMAAGIGQRPGRKRTLVKVHQQLALAGLAMIGVHGLSLLGDKWLNPGLTGIAVPFTIAYRPLWVGLGIIAGYLALLLGPTYFQRRRLGTRRWRKVHRATVVVYVLAVLHSLNSGTDGASSWFRALVVLSAVPILVLLVVRYRRKPARGAARPARRRVVKAPTPADALGD